MKTQTPDQTPGLGGLGLTIIVGGDPGAGKTTLIKDLLEWLSAYGYKSLDMGQIRRKKAEDMKMTLVELNKLAEVDHSIDHELEEIMKQKLLEDPCYIVTSRTAAHMFSPEQFGGRMIKVYLSVHSLIGAQRILNDRCLERENEDVDFKTLQRIKTSTEERQKADVERYKQVYNIDISDMSVFDIIIPTDNKSPEVVNDEITKYIEDLLNIKRPPKAA